VRRARDDSGASALEWALLTPFLLLVLMAIVQFAMVYHAEQVALAAAQTGARTARTDTSGQWASNATARTNEVIGQLGPGMFAKGSLLVTPTGDVNNRWVDVRASVIPVIPFLGAAKLTIHEKAGGPIECFRPDVGNGTNCK
jgi:Flp pilus assembly protein TadG